jgi:hypothetical protein
MSATVDFPDPMPPERPMSLIATLAILAGTQRPLQLDLC